MMNRSIVVWTLLLVVALGLWGCPSAQQIQDVAPCVKDTQQQLLVEWGTYEPYEAKTGLSFELTTRGELIKVVTNASGTTRTHVAWVPHAQYCAMADDVNATFLKVQALHSPGTMGRFIRYSNPATRVYLQAVWNPELQTFQSRDMRRVYDELMRLVPTDAID